MVVGALCADGTVDKPLLQRFIRAARPMRCDASGGGVLGFRGDVIGTGREVTPHCALSMVAGVCCGLVEMLLCSTSTLVLHSIAPSTCVLMPLQLLR